MAKRFAAHFGNLDNLSQLASMGFNEAGLVYPWDGTGVAAGTAAAIHRAGIPTAVFSTLNDVSTAVTQPNAAGAPYAGYFSALASSGWDCIAGEGCGGSVVGTAANYCTYINYGLLDITSALFGEQVNMYAAPWNHPVGGHWDYIQTYDGQNGLTVLSTLDCLSAAVTAGARHLGILIQYPNPLGFAANYMNIIDQGGCDTICFWGDSNTLSSSCVDLAQELIQHYGGASK